MPLPREHLLDELATAYVQAVAAAGGATIAVSRRDYGVDGTLSHIEREEGPEGERFASSGFPVDFQLKGTTAATIMGEQISYDLKVRNYDQIVTRPQRATPFYLFLVCFDADPGTWLAHDRDQLILNASAYWWRQSGVATTNVSSVRLKFPAANRLTFDAVEGILEAAKERFES